MAGRQTISRWIVTGVAVACALAFVAAYRADLPLDELMRRYADADSRFIDLDGMRVHYKDQGQGPVLVLLHGTSSSLQTWDGWVEALRHDYRVIRMDLPGFGLTGPDPARHYTVDRYVDFVDAFATAIGLEHFHLGGNSLGGLIAWHYAIRRPGRVDRLVLVDAAGYPGSARANTSLAFRVARIPVLNRLSTRLTPRALIEKSLREVYGDDSRVTAELVDRYYDLVRRPGNREAFVDRVRDAADDAVLDPRQVTQPTLILWGGDDRWISVADGQGFQSEIPHARLLVYPGVGHVPMEEVPGPSARATSAFLSSGTP